MKKNYAETCCFHYCNAVQKLKDNSVEAVDSIWLFFKELLEAAYDLNYDDFENKNLFFKKCDLSSSIEVAIKNIRARRNSYQHDGVVSCSMADCSAWEETLHAAIHYINSHSKTGFSFKLKPEDAVGEIEETTVEERGFFYCEEKDIDVQKEYVFNNSLVDKWIYHIAYGDSDKSFEVSGSKSLKNSFPFYSVIHNFLTRGKTISESSVLKKKELSAEEMEIVYIYEIVILRAICAGLCVSNELWVSSNNIDLVKVACEDICFYLECLQMMSFAKVQFPRIHFCNFSNEFEAGNTSSSNNVVASLITKEATNRIFMPKMLSSHIHYIFDDRNSLYYSKILEILFGYEEFRSGQVSI